MNEIDSLLSRIDSILGKFPKKGSTPEDKLRQKVDTYRENTNASQPAYQPKNDKYKVDLRLGQQGLTDPLTGEITLGRTNQPHQTLAHEAFHQFKGKDESLRSYPSIGSGDSTMYRKVKDNMLATGEPLAANYGDGQEETLAELYGIEASFPKGVAITADPFGQKVLDNQRAKDWYFHNTSKMASPDGGIWEGQSPEWATDSPNDSFLSKMYKKARRGM